MVKDSRLLKPAFIIVAVATLLIAGCGEGSPATATSVLHTLTAQPIEATPLVQETEATPTPTSQPATATPEPATATPTSPSATPTSPPPSDTPTTTALPPTATSVPPTPAVVLSPTVAEAMIHSFHANVDVADPGDTIVLTWHWSGGTEGNIYHLLPTGQLSTPHWAVEETGSREYTIPTRSRNYESFVLYVSDEDGVLAQETLQVALRCPDEWFFSPPPDICPAGAPLVSDGAEQRFEHGVMLWIGGEDRIYVLFDDAQHPRWSAYTDEWDEGEPAMDPELTPPPGLQQPVRGFGLLWRENRSIRERLGWAVDQERGYETALQRTSHHKYPILYIRALDGGVWKLRPNGSDWAHLTRGQ